MQRQLPLIGGALAIVFVGLGAACGSEPVTRNPVGPSAPGIAGLQINGPATVPPGQSAQFTAATRLSDGTVKLSTTAQNLRWRSTNTSVLQVSASGLATAGPNGGDTTVSVEVVGSPSLRGAREVIVVPDGTYRLVGFVSEAEAPTQGIAGARVEVSGTPLVATTDGGGTYRLFGVPPAAEIRVTANGYLPVIQNVQLTTHATRNIQLPLDGPRLNLNGSFRLTVDVTGTCTGTPPLPADLRTRSYDATVTTTGSFVNVLLPEPRFRVANGRGNFFRGRADAQGITFTLEPYAQSFYYYYYYSYPSIAERLSNNTYVVVQGTAITSFANGGVSGPMNGAIRHYDARFPFGGYLAGCSSGGLRLTLTPR